MAELTCLQSIAAKAKSQEATLDLAMDLNCEFANFYSAMAYPGSPLYALAVRQGIPLPEKWSGYAQHSKDCLPLPTRYLTARDVLQFRDQAFLRYYTSDRYLGMVKARFGPEGVEHLKEMTSYLLERDLLTGKLQVPLVTLPQENSRRPAKSTGASGQPRPGDFLKSLPVGPS